MAKFGTADVNLIKAVAGAEQSLALDDSLMIGSVIGGVVDSLSKKASIQDGIRAGIQKEIDGKFKGASIGLPEKFATNLGLNSQTLKNNYAGITGNDVVSKSQKNGVINKHENYIMETEDLVGRISANKDITNLAPGHNNKTAQYALQIDADDYKVFTAYDKDGNPHPNIAVPKKVKPDPSTFTYETENSSGNAEALLKAQKENPDIKLSDEQLVAINEYKIAEKGYSDWLGGDHTLANGQYNPDKYQIMNNSNFYDKEASIENSTAELKIYNDNVTNLNSPQDHENILPASRYAENWKGQVNGYKGIELQNALFTDASKDGVDNSYASMFISQEADPKKHPNMYMDANGNPISFTGATGKEIVYNDGDWNALNEGQQQKLLEAHIRGEQLDGTYNPDANDKFHKNGYANFMGGVTRDAAEIKQKIYFENKGRYFNNGDKNPVNSTDVTINRKNIAFVDHKFNAAFPETMIGGDNFNQNLSEEGAIGKALLAEFPNSGLEINNNGTIEVKGTKNNDYVSKSFDFNGDDKKQELQRLKEYLQENPSLSDKELSVGMSMSNSVSDDDWKSMRRKKSEYHGYDPVEDYLRFEGSDGNLVTGKLSVTGYNVETKMYEVLDSRNVTHQVDEETLYPNGI